MSLPGTLDTVTLDLKKRKSELGKRILAAVVFSDIVLAVLVYIFGDISMLISSQTAFWSSVLIIAASFGSYRKMVRQRLEVIAEIPSEDRDAIEKIEDPHDLYSDVEPSLEERTFKEILEEEKQRMKQEKRGPLAVVRDSAAMFSIARMGAYMVLVAGFFYLRGSGNWHAGPYLISLAVPVAVIVAVLIKTESVAHE